MDKEDAKCICDALDNIAVALMYLAYHEKDVTINDFENSMLNLNSIITGLENKYGV